MSEPFIAEVKIFAGNFAPRSYAFCNGQLLPIAQNTALFSLVGTTYGGDGRTTLGLPNLQSRAPMHPGNGPGLTPRLLGQKVGVDSVTLTEGEMPNHFHSASMGSTTVPATTPVPAGNTVFARAAGGYPYTANANLVAMNPETTSPVGSSGPHNNRQPYLVLNFIIALQGLYPSRS